MRTYTFFVWFDNDVEVVNAGSVVDAAILATAKRIQSGLDITITRIEESTDDGIKQVLTPKSVVTLKEIE